MKVRAIYFQEFEVVAFSSHLGMALLMEDQVFEAIGRKRCVNHYREPNYYSPDGLGKHYYTEMEDILLSEHEFTDMDLHHIELYCKEKKLLKN